MSSPAPLRSRRAILLAALSAASLASACNRGRAPSSLQRHPRPALAAPVLLLGVDGFEWSVVLPLLAEGRMPALAALMERGVVGKLDTLDPTVSPRLWTTIATGKLPEVLAEAEEAHADLIVCGSHWPTLVTYLIGSHATSIVRHASCSVLVVRG